MKFNNNYITYVFLIVYFFAGCKVKQSATSEKISLECQKSLAFITNEVVENEEGWYEIKSIEKIYQEYDIRNFRFPFSGCLGGKSKAFLRELLGEPHREAIDRRNGINTIVYCFSKMCIEERGFGGMAGAGLIFFFDENDLVKDYYDHTSLIEPYRRLDRSINNIKKGNKLYIPSLQQDTFLIKQN